MKLNELTETWTPGALITAANLRELGACEDITTALVKRWPDGAAVTLENLVEAQALGADLIWLARHILSAPARAALNEACAPARAALNEAYAPARAALNETYTPALAAFNEACATALWLAIGGTS